MAAVVGLAAGFAAHDTPGGAPDAHAELTSDNGLLVSTREHFRLCVHTTEAVADPGGARADLVAGVARVQQHPDWEAAFGRPPAAAEAVAEASCPSVSLPERVSRSSVVGPGATEDPSPYRTWVHILDEQTADRVLGPGVPAATTPAEIMRDDRRQGATVSTAVLVRRGHLTDPAFRKGLLTEGIGLTPTTS